MNRHCGVTTAQWRASTNCYQRRLRRPSPMSKSRKKRNRPNACSLSQTLNRRNWLFSTLSPQEAASADTIMASTRGGALDPALHSQSLVADHGQAPTRILARSPGGRATSLLLWQAVLLATSLPSLYLHC